MKTFYLSFNPNGTYLFASRMRVNVVEAVNKVITWTKGFNPKVHLKKAETLEDAVTAFGLVPYVAPTPQSVTAEKHIENAGFTAIRIIGLVEFEKQLAAASKTSPKLAAIRAWINGIMAAYGAGQIESTSWPAAPYSFEETTSEAFNTLVS